VRLAEHFALPSGSVLTVLEAAHSNGWTETYLLPLIFLTGEKALKAAKQYPQTVIASLELSGEKGLLFDAIQSQAFHSDLLSLFISRKKMRCGSGDLRALPDMGFRDMLTSNPIPPDSKVMKAGPDGVSIAYGNLYLLRLARLLEEGVSPDLEIGARLAAKGGFANSAPNLGALNLSRGGRFYGTIGVLRGFVPNQGDAWTLMTDEAAKYYNAVKSSQAAVKPPVAPELAAVSLKEIPQQVINLTGAVSFEMAALLGRRTGEMHLALASGPASPEFAPELFSRLYQRSIYQSMSGHSKKSFLSLAKSLKGLPEDSREEVKSVLENQQQLLKRLHLLTEKKISAKKIRIHGNYSLRQALFTGKDFIVKDFAGDPGHTIGERQLKRSPLRDVAGMLLSFYYAAYAPFLLPGEIPGKEISALSPWIELWYAYTAGAFLNGYLSAVEGSQLLPASREETDALLQIFLIEKTILTLDSETSARPDWALVPARFLRRFKGRQQPFTG
jgi:maltose alpha-D-glucosyltransferase/alpha-amylase